MKPIYPLGSPDHILWQHEQKQKQLAYEAKRKQHRADYGFSDEVMGRGNGQLAGNKGVE